MDGVFTATRFSATGDQLYATGTFTGTIVDDAGNLLASGTQTLTLPVTDAQGTCEILHLELGPLDLNLLGLVVHLDKTVLDITAESGPGNLLGNLLCAVAGLLDQNTGLSGILQGIANLLNQILAALR